MLNIHNVNREIHAGAAEGFGRTPKNTIFKPTSNSRNLAGNNSQLDTLLIHPVFLYLCSALFDFGTEFCLCAAKPYSGPFTPPSLVPDTAQLPDSFEKTLRMVPWHSRGSSPTFASFPRRHARYRS
jgi:hypothetical protein